VKPVNFDYARPRDVEASLSLLAEDGRSFKVVAGSQSLGPMLKMRLVQPDLLVDITGIEELRQVKEEADGVVIGACVTHSDIEDRRVPDVTSGALPNVASGIAYRAVRNRGTIGGSLTHADPSADWIAILAALGASVTLRRQNGVRTIPVEDYMLGALEAPGSAVRPAGAIIKSAARLANSRMRSEPSSSIANAAFAERSSARPSPVRSSSPTLARSSPMVLRDTSTPRPPTSWRVQPA
jgi:CO/xanthine dehydrogenase FAD-binding subunit